MPEGQTEKINLSETILARGRKRTVAALHHPVFWAVEVGGGILSAVLFENQWAPAIFIVAFLVGLMIVATATAPIAQRDEARRELKSLLEFRSVAERLEGLIDRMRLFAYEFENAGPAPGDDLNYVSPGMAGRVQVGGFANRVYGPEVDPHTIRMFEMKISEHRQFQHRAATEFREKFTGELFALLGEAREKGCVEDDKLARLKDHVLVMEDRIMGVFLREIIQTCQEAAARLKTTSAEDVIA